MIQDLSTDILRIILQEYLNRNESKFFISTCKLFNNIDYLKYLQNVEGDICNFSMLFARHFRTLDGIYIRHASDPCPWLPSKWPKKVNFYRCRIKNLNPTCITDTEELHIHDNDEDFKEKVIINWKKFPKLKKILFSVENLDFSGIEYCQNIEEMFIDLADRSIIIPDSINKLPKLNHLYSPNELKSMYFEHDMFFIPIVPNNRFGQEWSCTVYL